MFTGHLMACLWAAVARSSRTTWAASYYDGADEPVDDPTVDGGEYGVHVVGDTWDSSTTCVLPRRQRAVLVLSSKSRPVALLHLVFLSSHCFLSSFVSLPPPSPTAHRAPDRRRGRTNARKPLALDARRASSRRCCFRYLACFYWAMTTITTVGCGDACPDPAVTISW